MEIRPIKSEADYRATLREIETLMDATTGSVEEERLEVLATLVQVYEARHYPILPPDPIDAILYQMECRGISRKELETYLEKRGRVSEILNRKRPLSIEMIRQISAHLDIPTDVLVRPYPTEKPTGKPKKASAVHAVGEKVTTA